MRVGHPISPREAVALKSTTIPAMVFAVVNELLSASLTNGRAVVYQSDVVTQLVNAGFKKDELFSSGWLNFEDTYETQGWEVRYDKPAYNETGRAHWVFTAVS